MEAQAQLRGGKTTRFQERLDIDPAELPLDKATKADCGGARLLRKS